MSGSRRGSDSPRVPDALARFCELVNRGAFWESHEVLEDPWREHGSDFYQGLILYASAFVHARRGNAHGIAAQLRKAEERLARYPSPYLGLDVDGIRQHARRTRERVEARAAGRPATGSDDRERAAADGEAVATFPELVPRTDRIRGDEPELAEDPGLLDESGGGGDSEPADDRRARGEGGSG